MVDILKKKLNLDFDAAVKHVETIVAEEGFNVMMVKAIDEIFKMKMGIENYPRYTSILACGPKFAKGALDVSLNMGLLFPCSFAVFEENNEIYVAHVSIMKIGPEVGLAPADKMAPVIKMTGEAVHRAWDRF
jgi:uncharacterized protein (DUF302 family)